MQPRSRRTRKDTGGRAAEQELLSQVTVKLEETEEREGFFRRVLICLMSALSLISCSAVDRSRKDLQFAGS